jgi:RNA polymerase sigma-70 factor (ECF subfamily)
MLAGTLDKKITRQGSHDQATTTAMTELEGDITLVQRIAAREDAALRELYAAYGQRMYAYALRLTGDPALAEDVVQDALVAVWRAAKTFRGESRLLSWLLGIVHHTALKALRGRPALPLSEDLEDNLPARGPLPEETVQASEQNQLLKDGLNQLSAEHRAALELVFYHEMSLNEAAEVCSCPVGTIKSRLSYARKQLRGLLRRTEEIE